MLLLSNVLVYQLAHLQIQQQQQQQYAADHPQERFNHHNDHHINPPFSHLPLGTAQALPSIRLSEQEQQQQAFNRKLYGGAGDAKHLGGFTDIDVHGISPATWKFMITYFGIKSIIDVGCGRGISTAWFLLHGVNALCVEGSHDALSKTMLPDPTTQMVEHDFSRGPWWPSTTTYDAVWCVEFLEHVGRNYQHHYVPTFRKAALLFVTHSRWGGWHHVEVHDQDWWIYKMQSFGFQFSETLTNRVRDVAAQEFRTSLANPNRTEYQAPNGVGYNAQHIWLTMMVFINPLVASLPQHAHLFAEPGCFVSRVNTKLTTRHCGEGGSALQHALETPLPPQFKPLELTPDMDVAWETLVRQHLMLPVDNNNNNNNSITTNTTTVTTKQP